jgi:hypothetical protein
MRHRQPPEGLDNFPPFFKKIYYFLTQKFCFIKKLIKLALWLWVVCNYFKWNFPFPSNFCHHLYVFWRPFDRRIIQFRRRAIIKFKIDFYPIWTEPPDIHRDLPFHITLTN